MAEVRPITQDQLDRLFTAALEAAIGRIEKDGYFHPFVLELRANGAIQAVAVLEAGPVESQRDPVERLSTLRRPRAQNGTIDGAAIAMLDSSASAVDVRLRAANYSADIRVPFTVEVTGVVKRKRRLKMGEFSPSTAINDIFGATR